jgi:hypothetical protein
MSLCFHCGADSPSRYCCLARSLECSRFDDLHSVCSAFGCTHKKSKWGTHCEHSDGKSERGFFVETLCKNNVMMCRKHNTIRLEEMYKDRQG